MGFPDETTQGLIAGLLLLGAFSANIYVGTLTDWIGRRKAILIGVIVFLIGGSIQAGAQNLSMIMAGRFFAGMGIGMLAMLAPLYQAEVEYSRLSQRSLLLTRETLHRLRIRLSVEG